MIWLNLLQLLRLWERAKVQRLQTFNILNYTFLGELFLLWAATSQDLLQALDLHQTLLYGWIVSVWLKHLEDHLKFAVLFLFIQLLL